MRTPNSTAKEPQQDNSQVMAEGRKVFKEKCGPALSAMFDSLDADIARLKKVFEDAKNELNEKTAKRDRLKEALPYVEQVWDECVVFQSSERVDGLSSGGKGGAGASSAPDRGTHALATPTSAPAPTRRRQQPERQQLDDVQAPPARTSTSGQVHGAHSAIPPPTDASKVSRSSRRCSRTPARAGSVRNAAKRDREGSGENARDQNTRRTN